MLGQTRDDITHAHTHDKAPQHRKVTCLLPSSYEAGVPRSQGNEAGASEKRDTIVFRTCVPTLLVHRANSTPSFYPTQLWCARHVITARYASQECRGFHMSLLHSWVFVSSATNFAELMSINVRPNGAR